MRSLASGADLHKYTGHLIAIEGILAQLLWADPEDNGPLVRIRTAERGREYLVRADTYAVFRQPRTDPERRRD